MQEAFLHYIWRHQYFDKSELLTHEGEELTVLSPGFLNENAGPDFSEAKIKIGSMLWSGSVEIHVKSSHWKLHQHNIDQSYDKVVLHVVWENDCIIKRMDETEIPTLELKKLVDPDLLGRYNTLIETAVDKIPCESSFGKINDLTKLSMLDKVVHERISNKAKIVNEILDQTKGDWEETSYRLLIQAFGLKVNTECFGELGKLLPFKILKKYNTSITSLESLLFGISGFLEDEAIDDYHTELKKEFDFLRHKHGLTDIIDHNQWKFMRLRPANFPTLRLAQLASALINKNSVFQNMVNIKDVKEIKTWLKKLPSSYWVSHYNFGKESSLKNGSIGDQTIEILIINTLVPLLVSYGKSIDDQSYIDRAISILEEIKAENNKITRVYSELGYKAKSSFDSQGLIQLYNQYCTVKRCLSCSIGTSIVRSR